MAIYNNSVQTDKGRALETRSRNGEGAIEFVCIKTGAGIYSGDERLRLREMTELKEMKQEFRFSGIKPEKEYDYLSLESVIKNEGIEEGYYFTEVGIYARIRGEEENVLYCIGLVDEPDYIPPHTNGKTYEIVLQSLIKCYDAEHVTIEYMDTVYATAESLMEHVSDKNNPHDTTKAQVGLGNADNTADADKPVSGPQQAALDAYYAQSTGYADQKVADLINGAPSTLDTLGELAQAMQENEDMVEALEAAIGSKASAAEFDSHTKDDTKHITSAERTKWNDKMETAGGSANNTVTFSSGDATSPSGWADIEVMTSGEKHSSLFRKMSLAVKNLRYLWRLLGTTSLAGIGDGTVTGAISSLNTGLGSRLRFFEYGIYDYEDKGLDIDIIIKDIYGKLPYGMSSGCFVYATHYYMTAEKTSNTFGSIVLFSYNVVGVTVYKCVDGHYYKNAAAWTQMAI